MDIEHIRKTKCKLFGSFDAMDGGCHYCYYDDKELFDQCVEYQKQIMEYFKKEVKKNSYGRH